MRRSMRLIIRLLQFLEKRDNGNPTLPPESEFDGYTDELVHYHIGLCVEAGFIVADPVSGAEEPYVRYAMKTLTWKGHEKLVGRDSGG